MLSFLLIFGFINITYLFVFNGKNVLDDSKSKKNKIVFLVLTVGLLIVLNCLRRLDVGNDTSSYYLIFKNIAKPSKSLSDEALQWIASLEKGFLLINKGFQLFSTNYQIFISLIAIFVYVISAKTIYDYSDNIFISIIFLFLFFFHIYINVLRESIAICMILIGYRFLIKKKIFLYFVFVIFAILFHKTAFIALAIPVFYRKKPISLNIKIFLIIFVMLLTIFNVFTKILYLISYSTKYVNEETGLSTYLAIVLALFFLALFYTLKVKPENDSDEELRKYNFYSSIPFIHLLIQIAGLELQIMYRFSYYFLFFYILAIPYYFKNSTLNKQSKTAIFLVFLAFIFAYNFGAVALRPEWYSEFDYRFFWE